MGQCGLEIRIKKGKHMEETKYKKIIAQMMNYGFSKAKAIELIEEVIDIHDYEETED